MPTLCNQIMAAVVEKLCTELKNLLKIKQGAGAFGKPKKRIKNFEVQIHEKAMKF